MTSHAKTKLITLQSCGLTISALMTLFINNNMI